MTDLSISSYAAAAPATWTMDVPTSLALLRSEDRSSPQWCEAVVRALLLTVQMKLGQESDDAAYAVEDILGWELESTNGNHGDYTDHDDTHWTMRFLPTSARYARLERMAQREAEKKHDVADAAILRNRARNAGTRKRRAAAKARQLASMPGNTPPQHGDHFNA